MKADGHIHTPYCPHGSKDTFEQYITKAIQLGFNEISFTEHAPLPIGFVDPTPDKDSAMAALDIENYFSDLSALKEKYQNQIKINTGLEVDYIEGFEEGTKQLLNEYGKYLDDSILSVHFLKTDESYYCVDYSPDMFHIMVNAFSSVDSIYEIYYQTLLQSISSDLGPFKPERIGHITLVHKFQKRYQPTTNFSETICKVLDHIASQKLSLDYNGAGMNKPLCREPYPPHWIVREAIKRNIPLIYGSDAHRWKELQQGYDALLEGVVLQSPTNSID